MKRTTQIIAGLLFGLGTLAAPCAIAGGTPVSVSTGSLAPGTYYLDFQLTAGNLFAGASTAALASFSLTGGSLGAALPDLGGVSGDLTGGLTLTDDAAAGGFAEYTQAFTLTAPGQIGFTATLAATTADPAAPDTFVFSLLDSTLAPLPTTSPFPGALASENITTTDPALLQSGLQQYALAPVPEASTLVSFGLPALGGIGLAWRRRTVRPSFLPCPDLVRRQVYSSYEPDERCTDGQNNADRSLAPRSVRRKRLLASADSGSAAGCAGTDAAGGVWLRSFYRPTSKTSYGCSTRITLSTCW